jgi:hypothetical protein
MKKFCVPEIVLGVFLAVAIFAMGMLFASSRHPPAEQKSAAQAGQSGGVVAHKDSENKLTDWLLVLFNGLLFGSTILLWNANNRSAKIAERALTEIERAFVSLDGFNFELTTKEDMKETEILEGEPEWHRKHPGLVIRRFALQPQWKNSGNTPTKNMTIQVDWRPPPYAVPEPKYIYRGPPQPFFVAPGAIEPSDVIDMPWAQAIIDASWNPAGFQPQILIWGRADYEDIFGRKHFVEWCHVLRLSRSGGERLRPSTIQFGKYNRSD